MLTAGRCASSDANNRECDRHWQCDRALHLSCACEDQCTDGATTITEESKIDGGAVCSRGQVARRPAHGAQAPENDHRRSRAVQLGGRVNGFMGNNTGV